MIKIEFNKNELIKSPLNYIGGKFKLLPQILPYFPENINTFYDMFGGGLNVGINIKANKIIYNDIIKEVTNLLQSLYDTKTENCLIHIDNIIKKYNLSKTNKEGFLKLRENYNNGNKDWYIFYSLLCYSFNNQIRFNSKGQYNMPFGKDRSSFNLSLRNKFIKFVEELHSKDIEFLNKDFRDINIDNLSKEDFVYLDPPYLITCATYNEKGSWNQQDDIDLMNLCDKLNSKNIKFAMSNVLENKDKENKPLKEWCNKYNIYHLNMNYNGSNYQRKNKNSTDEVLITNY